METSCQDEHYTFTEPITFTPDYDKKIRISIENIPIELKDTTIRKFLSQYGTLVGKTYFPRKRYENTYFITGTRIYSCTNIKEHLPKHIYKFGRHLRIRYDNQPTQNKELQQETELQESDSTSDIEEDLPRNLIYIQQEIPTNNIQRDNNSQQTSEDEQ